MIDPDGKAFFSQEAFDNPHLYYDAMREISPVCQIGDTRAFLVGSYNAVADAVKRTEDFSSNLDGMLACVGDAKPVIFDLTQSGAARAVIATADEPDHLIQRRLMLPPLKPSKIDDLEPELREFARERIKLFLNQGGGDICPILTESLPAYVVLNMLGLPDDALDAVQRWAMMGGDFMGGRFSNTGLEHIQAETAALTDYMSAHFDRITSQPKRDRGDSLTALLADGVQDGLISTEQAIGILVILFGAAAESTASLLGSALRMLAEDQDMQTTLRAKPELIPPFIEEVVRLESPFKFHYRVVRKNTALDGVDLKEGDLLLLGWAAANRDPEVWDRPNEVILDRKKSLRHFGFGYGRHFCIGAPLARLEVSIALEELLSATSKFELSTSTPYKYCRSIMVRRVLHLNLSVS